ncbi:MAG: yqhD, partial [Bacteroidetes bacterium]|nr:yqhD [Bacteroidota bacterium]
GEKGDKILQYGQRVWGISGTDREQTISKIIEKTEEFFRSLGLKTRLSENGAGEETINEIVRRFEQRDVHYGENRSVDAKITRQILERVI